MISIKELTNIIIQVTCPICKSSTSESELIPNYFADDSEQDDTSEDDVQVKQFAVGFFLRCKLENRWREEAFATYYLTLIHYIRI